MVINGQAKISGVGVAIPPPDSYIPEPDGRNSGGYSLRNSA